jgi:translation initiation factor 5A
MSTKVASIGSMQKGNYIIIDGEACRVVDVSTSKPGKHGHAKVRVIGVGIVDGRKREIVKPGHDNVEVPIVDKRNAQVLSITGNKANIMDSETYETFDIEIPEELKEGLHDGSNILYWQILNQKVMKQVKD